MKRGRDTLTGGSGDVNPQLMTVVLNQTTTNYTEVQINTPVTRLGSSKTKATIIEVLKVYFDLPSQPAIAAALTSYIAQFQLSTNSLTTYTPADPAVFAFASIENRAAFTAGGTMGAIYQDPAVMDLTDGAGHGLLIATDKIFYSLTTTNYSTGVGVMTCKILYRFKEVGLTEYIGIVQSQTKN